MTQKPVFAACFTADTKIKTKDGSKNISDIKVGDEVYSENPETGETGYQKVKEVFVTKTNTILTIKTQNETIETTKPHPFYVIGKGFVVAKDLQVGDHLKMANGEEAFIESLTLKHYKDPVTVYNFEVENWHTYHVSASEVLVHNVAAGPCGNAGGAVESVDSISKYKKANFWERLTVRKVSPNELKANPLDDISNPKIGPSDTALSKHMKYIAQNGSIDGPIEVQKLSDGGYEIVNGHHRWLAAQKAGLKKVPISIKNYNN